MPNPMKEGDNIFVFVRIHSALMAAHCSLFVTIKIQYQDKLYAVLEMIVERVQKIDNGDRISASRGGGVLRNDPVGQHIKEMREVSHMAKKQHGNPTLPKMDPLTRLIARREWEEIEFMLFSTPIDQIEIDKKNRITDQFVLHFALRFGAPLRLVKLLALKYPKCLTSPDSTGKYACHVACKYGADPGVLEFLVTKNSHAASVQDPEGKAPIHYVGEYYAKNYESPSSPKVLQLLLQVISILRRVAPHSFNLEDEDGCNAVEYAIANDYDMKVIKTMQRAARDDWNTIKETGQGKTHDEMERVVKMSSSEAHTKILSLGEVLASSVSMRNLGCARSLTSSDFPRRRNHRMAKSMCSESDVQGRSFIAKSA
jgi:hypothetical protein